MDHEALYLQDGDAFVATGATKGSWYPNAQSGGPVLALLGHVLEDVPTLTPMSLARLTVDLVRPAPVGAPMHVATTVVREGKKLQVVDLSVTVDGVEQVRARALRLRDADLSDPAPERSRPEPPAPALPRPEDLTCADASQGADFLRFGAEFRQSEPGPDGATVTWVRLRIPVVAGQPVRDTSRTAMAFDCVNLIGVDHALLRNVSAINADVSATLVRRQVGEWTGMRGTTQFDHHLGHGLSAADLHDEVGRFGVVATSQLLQPTG